MSAPLRTLGPVVAALAIAGVSGAPAASAAGAAKLRIAGGAVTATDDGRVRLTLVNGAARPARGTLRVTAGRTVVGAARFRIPARRTRGVHVPLTAAGARLLTRRRSIRAGVVARTLGARAAKRTVTLRGRSGAAGPAAPPAAPGPAPQAPPPPQPGAGGAAPDGRYQGRYAENSVHLAFNIVGARLFTGPFDSFFLSATCRNADPAYTGPDQVYPNPVAIEPISAAIAADGTFAEEGTYLTGNTPPIAWRIAGAVTGPAVSGELSATYADAYGNPCSGVTRFQAGWYGAYTL